MKLEELRERLASIDRRILELAADRQRLAHLIGEAKDESGRSIRNFAQEKEVIERARQVASKVGISKQLAQTLMQALIREALATQERQRVQAHGKGYGQRALIIGGAGRMGRWFASFLRSQGYRVEIADPAGPVIGFIHHNDWHKTDLDHDLVLVATDLRMSQRILSEMIELQPPGLILDIGSLKSPLSDALLALSQSGLRIASIHPMFGPDTVLLSNRHIIFVDIDSPRATLEAKELFTSTMAQLVDMTLEEHDRAIAYVLGLSHALNIAFPAALAESGEAACELAEISSQTFDQQMLIAGNVTAENPHLYFEIQALNRFSEKSLACLTRSLDQVSKLVSTQDESGFVALMVQGRDYLADR